MSDKKLIFYSYSSPINQILLYKEHGEIPYYFSKIYGYDAVIDDYYDPEFPNESMFRTVRLERYQTQSKLNKVRKIFKIFRYAKKIDILYLLSITPDSLYKMIAYRLGGGKGKIYLKLDLGIYAKNGKDLLVWENMSPFLKIAHFIFKPLPDLYTVETKQSYARLSKSYYGDLIGTKLFRLPNGFDPELLEELGITRRHVSEKEKILLTVGRIGTHQKNTELLLDVLAVLSLGDWKMYIVGPIEDDFQPKIDAFYQAHPEKRESVVFTGMISQREKFLLYDRARVFVLTSRHEGFAFALVEAAYMKNYIVSTDVGGAEDVLDYTGGYIVPEQKKEWFVSELQRVILMGDGELDSLVFEEEQIYLRWDSILEMNGCVRSVLL